MRSLEDKMIQQASINKPFLSLIISDLNVFKKSVIVLISIAILTISAKFYIILPFSPVPITFQTFVVLSGGIVLGWQLAAISYSSYLLLGLFGLPVFQNAKYTGMAVFHSPTLGYLIGFIMAGMVLGYLTRNGLYKNYFIMFLLMILGSIIIYAFGVIWLAIIFSWDFAELIQKGVLPFLIGDTVKIALGTGTVPILARLLSHGK